MLKLLLDEHISPDVANGLRRNRTMEIRYMVEWDNGHFLGREDSPCLREAAVQGLTLVTYDPEDDSSPAQNLGGRRANPRGRGFCGRKNNFARGYRRFGLGLDQTGKRNWELGLDE